MQKHMPSITIIRTSAPKMGVAKVMNCGACCHDNSILKGYDAIMLEHTGILLEATLGY